MHVSMTMDLGGMTSPSGLAYLAEERLLVVLDEAMPGGPLATMALAGDPAGLLAVDDELGAPTSLAAGNGTLYSGSGDGIAVLASDGGARLAQVATLDMTRAGVMTPDDLAFDRSQSILLVADTAARRILRLDASGVESSTGAAQRRPCELRLVDGRPAAIAVRSTDAHLFVARPGTTSLLEVGPNGEPIAEVHVEGIDMSSVQAMTFGPSAHPAAPPTVEDLYLLVEGTNGRQIIVVADEPPAPMVPSTVAAATIDLIQTSTFAPPSSDPGGVAWDPSSSRLIITDSDIDELTDYAGSTVFTLGADGAWDGLGLPSGTTEVSDVAVDPAGGRWFFSDDGLAVVVEVRAGRDGVLGTTDDRMSRFSTSAFGSEDPEGIAYGQLTLFISDGANAEVYRISAGGNGVFDGVAPSGDDTVASFDTAALGLTDPEAVTYDSERGTLYVMSRRQQEAIIEVTTAGTLVRTITLDHELTAPAGLTLAPPSGAGEPRRLFLVDRGEDNARSDVPNDGRLIELHLPT